MKNSNICKFTFTKELSRLTTSCFVLESNHDSMTMVKDLTHHCIILVTQRSGTFILSNNKFSLKKGSLVFGFKGETFTTLPEEKLEYMYIYFDGNRADELFQRFGISQQNRVFENLDGIIPLWQNSLACANENTIDLASESILLYTFSRLFKNSTERDSIITKILKLSEEEFTDPELSLVTISSELGYNSKYISHLFKEKMKITYSEYLRNLRIKYAVSLFDHGLDSVKNVALLSGFSDPLYFSTVFKNSIGFSPTNYINSLTKQ